MSKHIWTIAQWVTRAQWHFKNRRVALHLREASSLVDECLSASRALAIKVVWWFDTRCN